MRIEDNRIQKEANIGDIIVTDKNNKYILLINDRVSSTYPIAICNIEKDYIEANTLQKVFCTGGTLLNETIMQIIPKNKVKLVIE